MNPTGGTGDASGGADSSWDAHAPEGGADGSSDGANIATTLAGQAPLSSLAAGTYTHGRVSLVYAAFSVDVAAHTPMGIVSNRADVMGALADMTYEDEAFDQGEATYDFMGFEVPATLPPLPTTGGGTVIQEDGETWMIFPFVEPLVIGPGEEEDRSATIKTFWSMTARQGASVVVKWAV